MNSTTNFPWTEAEFEALLRKAVTAYWRGRSAQAKKQVKSGQKDAGTRGEVTGGQHLNAFANLLIQVVKACGCPDFEIHFVKPLVLPGYYRAQKKWDIVITKADKLIAAIELKSQSGSFGNNLNNRSEEVLGLSRDFWTAYRERAFGISPQPWLGYFFLLEDAPKSRSVVKLSASRFPAFSVFEKTSNLDRYRILCERLMLERDYSCTALLASPKKALDGAHLHPSPDLSLYRFSKSLFQHLRANA
jgi:type II restriction enzyme